MNKALFNTRVQTLILVGAGVQPTIPNPVTLTPLDSGWKSTDIMLGEYATNITDDKTYTRTLGGIIQVGSVGAGAVTSVNGQVGAVVLNAADVGAQPSDADLTAIAALATTAFGRGLLTLADQSAAIAAILGYNPSRNLWVKNDTAAHTGTGAETKVASKLIAANTIPATALLEIILIGTKTGTAGNHVYRVYFNTADQLAGATLVATFAPTAANLWGALARRGPMKSATTQIWAAGSINDDILNQNTAKVSTSIDFTQPQYCIVSIQLGNGADTAILETIHLRMNIE